MDIQQAILVELFAILLVIFGGVYLLNSPGGSFEFFVNLGLILGVIGVIGGFLDGKFRR